MYIWNGKYMPGIFLGDFGRAKAFWCWEHIDAVTLIWLHHITRAIIKFEDFPWGTLEK